MSYKKEFVEFMLSVGALTFGDFTTKSGRKTSYFINTGSYKKGSQIEKLGEFYAKCIYENMKAGKISKDIDCLFGPAYKGIPLVITTAIALNRKYNIDVNYCFNRKEVKDHGEGGSMVGYKLQDGDKVLMIEDVITAGTAVRECMPVLYAAADIKVEALIISVDRMEKGIGNLTATEEIEKEFGIKTFSIVNVDDIKTN
jgi:orotate phosphoribosyltransferase